MVAVQTSDVDLSQVSRLKGQLSMPLSLHSGNSIGLTFGSDMAVCAEDERVGKTEFRTPGQSRNRRSGGEFWAEYVRPPVVPYPSEFRILGTDASVTRSAKPQAGHKGCFPR